MRTFNFFILTWVLGWAFLVSASSTKKKVDDCAKYRFDVSQPLLALKQDVSSSIASSVHFFEVPEVNSGRWSELLLHEKTEEQKIEWLVEPQSSAGAAGSYGGIASFKPKQSGDFYIAVDQRAWVDLVHPERKELLQASSFEMQSGCDSIYKVVNGYSLTSGQRYLIQIAGVSKESVRLFFGKK